MTLEWLDLFRAAVADLDGPLIGTLATVDAAGAPRARSVVCREVGDDGSLWVTSDARSDKADHLRRRPEAELVFWRPASREQFRFVGRVELITSTSGDAAARERHWRRLTDASRAMFRWPAPGRPRTTHDNDAGAFPASVAPEAAVPDSFEVIVLHPTCVERLQLAPQPHRRTRWREAGGWSAEPINP
jgi:PPOX class probable FMN-dependent enzyme